MPKITQQKREFLQRTIRDKVFEESCRILKDKGLGAFTMQALADAVGVSKGTLYNYFKDKKDVLIFINGRFFDQVAAEMEQLLLEEQDYRKALWKMIHITLLHMSESRFMRFIAGEMHYRTTVMHGEEDNFRKDPEHKIQKVLVEFFRRGMEHGVFRGTSPELLELVFTSVLDGLDVRSTFEKDFDAKNGEQLDQAADAIMYGFCVSED